jgi:DNA-damage-inducible protein D
VSYTSPFEQIRHESDEGNEFWSARELAKLLGYVQWRNFAQVITQAQKACETSGQATLDHFADVSKMVTLGSGAQREIEDVHLSRYACYLIVQNADPEKPIVALGQTYFAVQTRRAELAGELAGMTEDQKRLYLRDEIAERNLQLAETASEAGVVTTRDFAVFQNHGYRGLYGGETAKDIANRKGLKPGQAILDHMNFSELAANMFRIAQTEEKLRREDITGKEAANQAHFEVGRVVRRTIQELGGTLPEDQPTPTKSIQQVRREQQPQIQAGGQLSLFAADAASDDTTD